MNVATRPHPQARTMRERLRAIAAGIGIVAVGVLAVVRVVVRRIVVRWEKRRDVVAPGEVLISIPNREGAWWQEAAAATLSHTERRAGPRWDVKRLDLRLDD